MTPNWSEEGFRRIIDAANRGRIKQQEKLKRLQEEYYKNPKKCLNCNEVIEYKKKEKINFVPRNVQIYLMQSKEQRIKLV